MLNDYLAELNKEYGEAIELPSDFDFESCDEEIIARIMFGESIDSAIQSTF